MSFVPPNEEELAAVERLRKQLDETDPASKEVITDTAILRFLRGRKGDEEKALRGLCRHLEWRKEHNVDSINDNIHLFESELNSGKIVVKGEDHHGRPAVFIFAKKHDKNKRNLEEVKLLIIHTLEAILKKAKPDEERIMICFDLSGFSYACMDYEVVKLLIDILQYNYPDTLHTAFIINSPFIFSACWAIIRPWLDPVTAAKAQFVNKEQLKGYFPVESIPIDV